MLAIIGGSGLDSLEELKDSQTHCIKTEFGAHSKPLQTGILKGQAVAFLPRHGDGHKLAPHKINYRANLAALYALGVRQIVAINAVGAIRSSMPPGSMVLPDQIIDYTWGREHTRYESEGMLDHIDFTLPISKVLSSQVEEAFSRAGISVVEGGVYGCTQGPRLETEAEIKRFQRDGCDLIGMTMMPEAALAREFGIEYASICSVANWCAGIADDELLTVDEIMGVIRRNVAKLKLGLYELISQ